MVFRKPYGFLIKHFKLIHLFITAIMTYLVIKNREIYKYICNTIKDVSLKYNALSYINYKIYIYIAIILVLFLIVYLLLKYKNKPRNIYILSALGYIVVGIFMFTVYGYLTSIVNNAVEQKTIRLYKDLFSISLYFQYLMIIIMGIRGLGFDIKKFNFSKDVQELNLSNNDSEEVIVDFNVDTNRISRFIRKNMREFGYFLKEYKLFIIIILSGIFLILGIKLYNIYKEKNKFYTEGTNVGINNIVNIQDSYYDSDNNVVIVKFSIYKSGNKEKLNLENMILLQGSNKYYPNKNICKTYNKIATCYKQQYISNVSKNYIVTYSVDSINLKEAYIEYNDNYEKNYKIKLDMESY